MISNKCQPLTIVCWRSENGSLKYQAQSQDEEALVRAAAQLGMVLSSKKGSSVGKHHAHFLCHFLAVFLPALFCY